MIVLSLALSLSVWFRHRAGLRGRLYPTDRLVRFTLWAFVAYALAVLFSALANPATLPQYIRILLWGGCIGAGYMASRLLPGHGYGFLDMLVLSLLLSAVAGCGIEYFSLSTHSMYTDERLRFFTMHPSRLGLFSVLGAFYCANSFFSARCRPAAIVYGLSFLVFCLFMYLSAARAIILFSLVGFVVLCLLRFPQYLKRILVVSTLLFLVLAAMVYGARETYYGMRVVSAVTNITEDPTFKSRLPIWQVGWSAFTESPLLGQGPKSYRDYHARYLERHKEALDARYGEYETSVKQAHNIVLGRLAETGVAGALTFFLFYVLALLVTCTAGPGERWVGAFLLYYLLIGAFDDQLYRVNDSFVFLLIGLGLGLARPAARAHS